MREIVEYLMEEGIAEDYESAVVIEMNLGDKMRCMIQRHLSLRPAKCVDEPEKKPMVLKVRRCRV